MSIFFYSNVGVMSILVVTTEQGKCNIDLVFHFNAKILLYYVTKDRRKK